LEEATLVVSLRDQASGQAQNLLRTLDKLNVATAGTDKAFVGAERSVAKAAASLGAYNSSANTTNAVLAKSRTALAQATASVTEYQAALARLAVTQDASGTFRQTGGRFASNAQITQQIELTKGLAQAQATLAAQQSSNAVIEQFEAKRMQNAANAAGNAGKNLENLVAHSNATRYALYSASNAANQFGVALLALPVASAVLAASYERDFATVERATLVAGNQANALKASLIDLSKTVPVTFKNITDIAAAGAQLGIAPEGLVNFTRVVSMLTATTNLSAEAAENFLGKFAKIANVPQDEFTNLASSILNVGVHTAATESQIAKLATQLVGMGREAGFTVPQLIGLAGALASVSSVGPELARGTVTRFVQNIQKAVNSGGPALEAFAKTAGVTATEVQRAFGTDKFSDVFQKFVNGLDKVQESGGNAVAILNDIGVKSVRDVPLLLNLAAGHETLAQAMEFANEGYKDQSILAQHYAKINDTLISKIKELGNTFGAFLNSVGSSSTGPLKQMIDQVGQLVDGFSKFASTDGGQRFLIGAAEAAVFTGAILLAAGAMAKLVAGVQAGVTAYVGIKKAIDAYKVAAIASAEVNAGLGSSFKGTGGKMASFASFMSGPFALAMAAGVTAILIFKDYLDSLKPTAESVQNTLATAVDFEGLTKGLTKGVDNSFSQWLTGANVEGKFKDFNNSVRKEAELTGGNLWDQIVKGFGQGNLGEAQSMQAFGDTLKNAGTQLATLAQSNLPQAQNGFAILAKKTDGSRTQLTNLLNLMPDYKAELTRQLTISGQAASAQNLLKLAYGGVGAGALDTAGKAKVLTDQIDRQREFQAGLLEATGLTQKQVDSVGEAYRKSISPLTDFNSIVGQVQSALQASAQAQADATSQPISDFYDGASVSLSQFTAQLVDNNAKQATWFQNLITVATQYGNDAAGIFIQAGYSAVNSSILQQLVDATPEQAAAYIDAQTAAAEQAAAATGEALISAGQLVTSNGGKIGKDTALQMGKELLAGFSPADIMKQFNLTFDANPGVPQVDTGPAEDKLNGFIRHKWGDITVNLQLNTAPARSTLANLNTGNAIDRTFATGGYTGPGAKYQPAGVVHAGEFVFTKEATSRIGVSTLYSMMNGMRSAQSVTPRRGYAEGGLVSGSGFAALDAQSLQAIYALANRPVILVADAKTLASTVADGNAQIAYGGGN
jgi:TP901 family phage tail tape measure protein